MRKRLPIYKLTLRSMLRERVALSMVALLGLMLLLLPSALEGDGTLESEVRMHIRYTLGFATFLLAAMTLWVSCASLAGDLSSRRLHMVLTKPVSRLRIWWEKWLAVTTVSTGLLFICGFVTLLRVQAMTRPDTPGHEEVKTSILTSREPVRPEIEDLTDRAEAFLEDQLQTGRLPADADREALLEQALHYVRLRRNSVPAGETVSWLIPLQRPVEPGEDLQLGFRLDGASMGLREVTGTWTLRASGMGVSTRKEVSVSPFGSHILPMNQSGSFTGARVIEVSFLNQSDDTSTVFFSVDDGIQLFRPAGGFIPNLIRALLLNAGLLALLAAVGVGAGATFSLPVACYVTAVVLLLQAFSGVVESTLEQVSRPPDTPPSAVERLATTLRIHVYKGVLVMMDPLEVEKPYDRVSRGVLVSGREVANTLLLRFTPVLILISGIGVMLFSRREAGDAS